MAKAPLDLATAPLDEVKKHLKKLKSREAELELALTLRNDPTVEEQLVRMTTCVTDLKATEKSMQLAVTPVDEAEIEAQKAQIETRMTLLKAKLSAIVPGDRAEKLQQFYQDGLAAAERELNQLGMSKLLLKLQDHFNRTQAQLHQTYAEWQTQGIPEQFDPFEHIPGLDRYLEKPDNA